MKTGYIHYAVQAPFWTRVKFAAAMVLTPLTIILMGRSIRIEIPSQEGGDTHGTTE